MLGNFFYQLVDEKEIKNIYVLFYNVYWTIPFFTVSLEMTMMIMMERRGRTWNGDVEEEVMVVVVIRRAGMMAAVWRREREVL